MSAATLRCFFAVFPPAATREAIVAAVEGMPPLAGFRPARAAQLHLTLVFLGDRPASQLADLAGAARGAAGTHDPFDLELRGLGGFPSLERPRVLYLGCPVGGEALASLQSALLAALGSRLGPTDDRPFRAHLTLGRLRERPAPLELARWRQAWPDEGHLFPVDRIELVRSELRPGGSRYSVVEGFSLGP